VEHAALPEQLVNQGCFAVVNVGDNGDISYCVLVHTLFFEI
jgi:hypothetical protein